MVEFDIRINPKQRTAYFPRQVVKHLGTKLKLVPNFHAGVIYPKDMDIETVLASIRVIVQDLELRHDQSRGGRK